MIVEMEQPGVGPVKFLNSPIKMSETNPRPRGPSPALGEATREVLKKVLGMTDNEVTELRNRGVV